MKEKRKIKKKRKKKRERDIQRSVIIHLFVKLDSPLILAANGNCNELCGPSVCVCECVCVCVFVRNFSNVSALVTPRQKNHIGTHCMSGKNKNKIKMPAVLGEIDVATPNGPASSEGSICTLGLATCLCHKKTSVNYYLYTINYY